LNIYVPTGMITDTFFETSIWASFKDNVKFYKFSKCMLGHKEDIESNDIYSIIIVLKTDSYVIDEVKITTIDLINGRVQSDFFCLLNYYKEKITEGFNKRYYRQILKYYYYKIYDIYKEYVY